MADLQRHGTDWIAEIQQAGVQRDAPIARSVDIDRSIHQVTCSNFILLFFIHGQPLNASLEVHFC